MLLNKVRRCAVIRMYVCLLVFGGSLVASAGAGSTLSEQESRQVERAIAAVKPALVRIVVAEVDYEQGREIKTEASGSGVIISRDGYVVTNHHVAGWAKRIFCTLASKEQIDADLVGTDPLADIAVIKLRGKPGRVFPTAKWGDSSKLRVGDRVLAMGSPLALSQSVTMGIVSNSEMIMPEMFSWWKLTLDGEDVGSMVRWIGHDAAIYGGNSGGPLTNFEGEIIGINEISLGLSGAIPADLARQVAEEIIKHGKVRRAWLGLNCQPLLRGSGLEKGVLIGGIMAGSPAAEAGFKSGDILISIAGKDVQVRFAEQLPFFNRTVAALPIDKGTKCVVLREGKELTLRVTPRERPEAEPKPREFKQWGICASNISFIAAREMSRDTQDGVLVRSTRPGGPSDDAKPSIIDGDVIVEAGGKPLANIAALMTLTDEITAGKTEPTQVLVAFERKGERLLTVVKVGTRSFDDPGREVRKAYLPVGMQVLTKDIADALGVPGRTGVRVTQVYPDSSAEKAGLKVGDLVVELGGEEIPASQPEDVEVLPAMIRQYKIGSNAELTVIRGNEEMKLSVVLEESPPLPREMKKFRDDDFEFTCRDLAFSDRMKESIDKDVVGVYVEEVSDGGWASLARLSTGDIVKSIDGRSVPNVSELRLIMEEIGKKKPTHIVLRVQRGIQEIFLELEPDWSNGR